MKISLETWQNLGDGIGDEGTHGDRDGLGTLGERDGLETQGKRDEVGVGTIEDCDGLGVGVGA